MRKHFIFLFLSVLACFALSSCRLDAENNTISNPLLGILGENTTALCSDGLDNNGDTLIDCNDPGCLVKSQDGIPGPGDTVCPNDVSTTGTCNNGEPIIVGGEARCLVENNEYACSDGLDNDGNGFTDCQDNNCKKTLFCCPAPAEESSLTACMDGIDNDCDGYTDCASFTCTRANRGASAESIAYCQTQNCPDGNGKENSLAECSDGFDNDCDGYIDCNSFTCTRSDRGASAEAIEYCNRDKSSKPENTEEACSDGKDNDLDGSPDCNDPECQSFAYCQNLTKELPPRPANFGSMSKQDRAAILLNEKTLCTDKIDNDHNGLMDCDEYRCHVRSLEALSGDEAQYIFDCD